MFKEGDRLICIKDLPTDDRIKIGKKFKISLNNDNYFDYFRVIPLDTKKCYFYVPEKHMKIYFKLDSREEKLRRILK